MDLQSVDGLGITFGDLSDAGKLKAIWAQLRTNQLSDELIAQLREQAAAVKAAADKGQADLDEVGTAARTTPNKRSTR